MCVIRERFIFILNATAILCAQCAIDPTPAQIYNHDASTNDVEIDIESDGLSDEWRFQISEPHTSSNSRISVNLFNSDCRIPHVILRGNIGESGAIYINEGEYASTHDCPPYSWEADPIRTSCEGPPEGDVQYSREFHPFGVFFTDYRISCSPSSVSDGPSISAISLNGYYGAWAR